MSAFASTLFAPGGVVWLLRHELRLSYRTMRAARGGRAVVIMGVGFVVLAVFVGLPLALASRMHVAATPLFSLIVDAAAAGLFTLMLSQTLAAATSALFERGDLDLLLSSPLSGRKVLAVRGVGIALNPFLIYAAFAVPAVVPSALVGRPAYLSVLPLMAAIAMLAACAGLGIAMALFAVIGARATRTTGQAIAGVIGAAAFLLVQLRRFAPGLSARAYAAALAWATPERFSPWSPLSWPARALLGSPWPLLAILVVCSAVFTLTLAGLGRRFVADASVSGGVDDTPARGAGRVSRARFSPSPLGAVMRKELRLLWRDPTLLSQVGLRVLYLIPLCFVLFRSVHGGQAFALAYGVGLISVVAAQVAGSLAWITVSAEDAPELIAASPAAGALARRGKLLAALAPVGVLLAPPLVLLLFLAPWAAVCGAVGVTLSGASAALINLWFEKPGSRSGFRKRSGSVVTGLAEFIVGAGWGVTTGLGAAGQVWSLAAAAVAAAMMAGLYLLRNPARSY